MLTPTRLRYIEICAEKTATQATNAELATQFDVHERTIDLALSWGKRIGIFGKVASEKLLERIAEARGDVEWLEKQRNELDKALRRSTHKLAGPKYINAIARELREARKLLLELEGLYKRTLAIEGPDGGPIQLERRQDLERLSLEERAELFNLLTKAEVADDDRDA